jgi:hypothetical protein
MVDTKNTKCPLGQIKRVAYTKKVNNKIIKVDSVCIKYQGLSTSRLKLDISL